MDLPIEYEKVSDLIAQGVVLFGEDRTRWKFSCPFCHAIISIQDWIDYAGNIQQANKLIGYECLGRLIVQKQKLTRDKDSPVHAFRIGYAYSTSPMDYCHYRTCSLFDLSPVFIRENNSSFFQFAP